MNFNQSTVQERKLYAGLAACTLKSFGLTEEELVAKGYSENFAKAFGFKEAELRNGEETVNGYQFTAILAHEETGEEFPVTFRVANVEVPKSSTGKTHYYADTLDDVWFENLDSMRQTAETHSSEYYRKRCNEVLENNPRPMKLGEQYYYNFLQQIIRAKRTDKDGNNMLPEFVQQCKDSGIDFDTITSGNTKALTELVKYLNTENDTKQVDYVTVPVVIRTSDNGNQNMQVETGYSGECFYRSNGTVNTGTVSAFKKYIDGRNERTEYANFCLFEPLREVTLAELLSEANTSSQEDEQAIQDIGSIV